MGWCQSLVFGRWRGRRGGSPSMNILSRIRIFCHQRQNLWGKYTRRMILIVLYNWKKYLRAGGKTLDGIDFEILQLQSAELRTTDGDRSKFANILRKLQIFMLKLLTFTLPLVFTISVLIQIVISPTKNNFVFCLWSNLRLLSKYFQKILRILSSVNQSKTAVQILAPSSNFQLREGQTA